MHDTTADDEMQQWTAEWQAAAAMPIPHLVAQVQRQVQTYQRNAWRERVMCVFGLGLAAWQAAGPNANVAMSGWWWGLFALLAFSWALSETLRRHFMTQPAPAASVTALMDAAMRQSRYQLCVGWLGLPVLLGMGPYVGAMLPGPGGHRATSVLLVLALAYAAGMLIYHYRQRAWRRRLAAARQALGD